MSVVNTYNAVNEEAMQQIASRLVESLGNLLPSRSISPNRLSSATQAFQALLVLDLHHRYIPIDLLLRCFW